MKDYTEAWADWSMAKVILVSVGIMVIAGLLMCVFIEVCVRIGG